jgi:hypothetical protein
MNRHERRKGAKVGKIVQMTLDEVKSLPCTCAWEGCTRDYDYKGGMPPGWTGLLLFCSTDFVTDFYNEMEHGKNLLRDTSLCPEHSEKLDGLLKFISRREMSGPVAGSA